MQEFFRTFLDIVPPLLVAALLGGIVGFEREAWRKPAGLRTHMMVALGAAAFMQLALSLIGETPVGPEAARNADPGRMVVGIATGLGFLGAGAIIQARGQVHGMTTAAGIWVVGAIGACCGAERYDIAVVAVILATIILAVLYRFEPRREP